MRLPRNPYPPAAMKATALIIGIMAAAWLFQAQLYALILWLNRWMP